MTLEIIEEIKVFTYSEELTSETKRIVATKPNEAWSEYLSFSNHNGTNYKIDLSGLTNNCTVASINENIFSEEEFNCLCSTLNLETYRQIKQHAKRTIGNKAYTLSLVNQKTLKNNILVVFYFDDGESRRSPVLYVEGIFLIKTNIKLLSFSFEERIELVKKESEIRKNKMTSLELEDLKQASINHSRKEKSEIKAGYEIDNRKEKD